MNDLFDQRFPADLSRMADLRSQLRERLERSAIEESQVDRMILVVDEIVSNSIEHGSDYRRSSDPIRVQVERMGAGLLLKVDDLDAPDDLVVDLGRVLAEEPGPAPEAVMERGRGMFLITMFLDDLEVLTADDGGMRVQGRLDDRGA